MFQRGLVRQSGSRSISNLAYGLEGQGQSLPAMLTSEAKLEKVKAQETDLCPGDLLKETGLKVLSQQRQRVQPGLSLVSVSLLLPKLHPGGQAGQDVRSSLQRSLCISWSALGSGTQSWARRSGISCCRTLSSSSRSCLIFWFHAHPIQAEALAWWSLGSTGLVFSFPTLSYNHL